MQTETEAMDMQSMKSCIMQRLNQDGAKEWTIESVYLVVTKEMVEILRTSEGGMGYIRKLCHVMEMTGRTRGNSLRAVGRLQ